MTLEAARSHLTSQQTPAVTRPGQPRGESWIMPAGVPVRVPLHPGRIDTSFWLALQANWDSFRAWNQLRRRARPAGPLTSH